MKTRAFTVIDILIVVVILGFLAAIAAFVIPQFTNSAQTNTAPTKSNKVLMITDSNGTEIVSGDYIKVKMKPALQVSLSGLTNANYRIFDLYAKNVYGEDVVRMYVVTSGKPGGEPKMVNWTAGKTDFTITKITPEEAEGH